MTMPELHPICAAFPLMAEKELQQLADDIKTNGLIEAITMLDGMILDGRNRWIACKMAGVEPRTVDYDGDDPIRFAVAKNERRRHCSYEERAFIAATLANLALGSNQYQYKYRESVDLSTERSKSAELYKAVEAAADLDVSYAAVMRARRVQRDAPDLVDMVKNREIKLSAAELAAANSTAAERASSNPDDIKRAAVKAREDGKGRRPAKGKKKPAPRRNGSARPYVRLVPLSDEDSGRPPPEASLQEKMAHDVRYGRVQLYPKAVKDTLDCRSLVQGVASQIGLVASPSQATIDQFFDALEQMAAWVPKPEKGNGFERDFARMARDIKTQLKKDLPVAMERLRAIEARLTMTSTRRDSATADSPCSRTQ